MTVYVTCDILQLYFVSNFWSHCGSLSFKGQERVWWIWSVQTPGSNCTIKDRLLKTFLIIWTAVIKPLTYTGVEAEWRPCLYRVGLFDKAWDLPPSRFPWETAHDNALSMNNAINCHSIWPRRWSWKFFGQIFSLKSGKSHVFTTWLREAEKNET